MPTVEQLTEVWYHAFLTALGGYRPPFAQPWPDVPEPVRKAHMAGIQAVLDRLKTEN